MLASADYPELANKKEFYDQVGKDLHRRGLLGTDGFHVMMSATGAYENRATELGQEFLNFIAEPEQDKKE